MNALEVARMPIVRSILTGMLVGATLSACNIYSGLKLGWSSNMGVTGALLSYAIWRARTRRAQERSPFTILETNLAQTASSNAATVSSAGLVAGIPALTILTGIELSWWELASWIFAVCLTGNVIAIPLRRQMLETDPLPFPVGKATAETLRQVYARGREAMARVGTLLAAAAASGAFKVLEHLKLVASVGIPGSTRGYALKNLTFAIDPSLLLAAFGGLMGLRALVSVFIGSVLAYGVIGPELLARGIVAPGPADKPWFKQLVEWLLWPGVSMMVVASLTHLALMLPTLVRGFRGLRDLGADESSAADAVPNRWFRVGAVIALVLAVSLQLFLFRIPIWIGVIGVVLSAVLAVVASRVAGETGLTPVGAMGKVTQLAVGVALPGNVAANLMTANITGGAASQCADMMNDLRTGKELGASPRLQWIAQVAGAFAGALVGPAIYLVLIPDPKTQLLTPQWPAPAVLTWKTVAEVFRVGVAAMPPGALAACAVGAAVGFVLAIAESRAPEKIKRWIPSPAAVGLTFVVPANQGLMLFLGGLVGLGVKRIAPAWHERFWVVLCAGVIAGEGLVGAGLSIHQMLRG